MVACQSIEMHVGELPDYLIDGQQLICADGKAREVQIKRTQTKVRARSDVRVVTEGT